MLVSWRHLSQILVGKEREADVPAAGSACTALRAVEVAVREMETNPLFNAGTGCALTSDGEPELDALISALRTSFPP